MGIRSQEMPCALALYAGNADGYVSGEAVCRAMQCQLVSEGPFWWAGVWQPNLLSALALLAF